MSSKTKIYVIKSKELIYTGLFVVVALILVILIACMLLQGKSSKTPDNTNTATPNQSSTDFDIPSDTDYTIPSVTDTNIDANTATTYTPGMYSTDIMLNGYYVTLSLTVDKDRIKAININNLTDAITTMYPLIEPALEDIKNELLNTNSIKKLDYSSDNQYTYSILSNAINSLIELASE